ncbi:MAG: hypothetical protein ACYTFI_26610, partial [Planctomycetota bacterium]
MSPASLRRIVPILLAAHLFSRAAEAREEGKQQEPHEHSSERSLEECVEKRRALAVPEMIAHLLRWRGERPTPGATKGYPLVAELARALHLAEPVGEYRKKLPLGKAPTAGGPDAVAPWLKSSLVGARKAASPPTPKDN